MSLLLKTGRSFLALLVGYAIMAVLITLVQEVMFGGVSYLKSSAFELVAAGILTFGCAVAGGGIAAWIAGRNHYGHAVVMSMFVVIETTALLVTGRIGGPLWFDLLASFSLIVGIIFGAFIFRYFSGSSESRFLSSQEGSPA